MLVKDLFVMGILMGFITAVILVVCGNVLI